ncbi:molybdenum ABC transporter ATP-binding protein [Paracoccus sp. (in: a-proteobacteria)]|uniref:molybdenum ABC transporter ATP-binding protein n=1 Tax=Paracoccus sp. TaxID=267 RepID=UPI00396C35E8
MSLSVRLRHRFAAFALDVDFDALAGVTALFGPSGAGKTTLINAVAGLLRPAKGRIEAGGAVLFDDRAGIDLPPHRRGVGYVFQDARLFPHLTVRQNLLFGRRFARGRGKGGADLTDIAALLGIEALLSRRPAALSGGEAQRVALGRALLSRPRLLLLDEPLAALDEARKAEILPYLERLRDIGGLPILYVSHSAAETRRLATTVIRLEAGRVTAMGPAQRVLGEDAPGVALEARLVKARDGIAHLDSSIGPLRLCCASGTPTLRLWVGADNVMIATVPPQGLLAQNVLPARVIGPDADPTVLRLAVAQGHLLARLPRGSAPPPPGSPVYAILTADPQPM